MSSFKNVPFSLMSDLQSGINRLCEQVWHSGIRTGPFDGQDWSPAVDVVEKYDRYLVEIELPGVCREDLEVSCVSNSLTVKGDKVRTLAPEQDDALLAGERGYGSFKRVVSFDQPVRSEAMSARLDKGVLHVVAPKKTATATGGVRIEITEPVQSEWDKPQG